MNASTSTARRGINLHEDWLATIIGLAIVFVIGAGLLGPGAQTTTLNAKQDETKSASLLAISGWQVSATLDGAKAAVADAPTSLQAGKTYLVTCENGELRAQTVEGTLPDGVTAPANGKAGLAVVNHCSGALSLTYKTNPIIPWPVFNIFKR